MSTTSTTTTTATTSSTSTQSTTSSTLSTTSSMSTTSSTLSSTSTISTISSTFSTTSSFSSTTSTSTSSSTISSSSSTTSTYSTISTTSTSTTTSYSTTTSTTGSTSTTTTTVLPGVRLTASIDLTGLVIEDEFGIQSIDSQIEYSLNSRPIIWEQEIPSGKSFDLIGLDDTGWLSKSTLDDLQALAIVPNAIYELRYDGELKTVRFRNEDPPVISANQIIFRSNIEDTDWYNNIRIKLMEI